MTDRNGQKITALYERLSKEDAYGAESCSITGQKEMLSKFAQENGFSNIRHYTDDGFSGGDFERPAWKELCKDIERGRIERVIVKDMSRIGRDYLQVGFYTEVVFPKQGVRFIAVANGVDSEDQTSGEFAPFLNVLNEWYLHDISRKIRDSVQAKAKAGKPISSRPPYGYMCAEINKELWIINGETAPVVRRIFQMAATGIRTGEIARVLSAEGIPTPGGYRYLKDRERFKRPQNMFRWSPRTIQDILKNPQYKGCTVNFKTGSASYKLPREKKDFSEWQIIEGTHEPIIDADTFEKAADAALAIVPGRNQKKYSHPLEGSVYCADCGAKMYRSFQLPRPIRDREGNPTGRMTNKQDFFFCSTFAVKSSGHEKVCSKHYVRTDALEEMVLTVLREITDYAAIDLKKFAAELQKTSLPERSAEDLRQELRFARNRYAQIDEEVRTLYESYIAGNTEKEAMLKKMAELDREQTEIEKRLPNLEDREKYCQQTEQDAEQFLRLAEGFRGIQKLTGAVVKALIDKIIVHEADRTEGMKEQEIEILFKFIGAFRGSEQNKQHINENSGMEISR